jgi:hypothetical protein
MKKPRLLFLVSFAILGTILYLGCGSSGSDDPAFTVIVSPGSHTFDGTTAGLQFAAVLKLDGNPVQADSWAWSVSDPALGTIDATGYFSVTGAQNTSGEITAEATYEGSTYDGSADIAIAESDVIPTEVYFNPESASFAGSDTVTVDLMMETDSPMLSWKIELGFQPTRVSCVDVEILGTNGIFGSAANRLITDLEWDNTNGLILMGAAGQADGFEGVSDTGILARIKFIALVADPASDLVFTNDPLEIYNFPVSNPAVKAIFVNTTNGQITE